MYKFKKGDRIQVVDLRENTNDSEIHIEIGMIGTVIEDESHRPWVEFDYFIGSSCTYNGSIKGCTMCMWEDEIQLMPEIKIANIQLDKVQLGVLQTNTCCEMRGENKNMELLNIYEQRKRTNKRNEYLEKSEKIIKEDAFKNLTLSFKKQILNLYKNEYEEETSFAVILPDKMITKETKERLEELRKDHAKEERELKEMLEEVKAQLEIAKDYDTQIKILKRYNILGKDNKINA